MEEKIKTLQNILTGCGYHFKVDNYDMTQPDSMDESDSNGAWDLAGDITTEIMKEFDLVDCCGDLAYQRAFDNIQSLLYNLFCVFKTEQEEE